MAKERARLSISHSRDARNLASSRFACPRARSVSNMLAAQNAEFCSINKKYSSMQTFRVPLTSTIGDDRANKLVAPRSLRLQSQTASICKMRARDYAIAPLACKVAQLARAVFSLRTP